MEALQAYLHVATNAAKAAAKIQEFYKDAELDIATKSSHTDLVTKVDKLCEEKIRQVILAAYPEHSILGEEEGATGDSRYRWIVDPLDGTLNYAHDFPFYCVSIALEIDGVVSVGVVLDGVRNELFTAIVGQGAFKNGSRISVSKEADLQKSLLATGFSYQEEALKANLEIFARVHPQVRAVRRPGAAALDLCYVACGRLEGFWELSLSPWDVAAGMLIIREAGGTLTGKSGGPYQLGDKVVVSSNGHIHAKLVHILGLGDGLV